METGIQPVMPVGNMGYGDGYGFGGGGFVWAILLFALLGGGGFGWGGNRGMATQADVYAANDMQDIKGGQRQLQSGINALGNGIADATFSLNTSILNGFNGTQRDIMQGNYAVEKAVTDARYVIADAIGQNRAVMQQNNCEIQRNIDALRYDAQMNAATIAKAISDDGEKTRALIVADQIQNLRDKVADKDRDLQTAQFALSQCAQNQYLVNAIAPCPKPAYVVPNPYCNCNNGCGCGVNYGVQ